jgi:hypothetical protein
MTQLIQKKSSTHSISYVFSSITGQIVNYRQIATRPAAVSYQTILIRDADGEEHLLQNINMPPTLDPFFRGAKGQITIVYVTGHGDGKNDNPFTFIAAIVTADRKMRSDIGSLRTYSRGVRAQARLPYLDLCKLGVLACLLMFVGVPVVVYAVWRLMKLETPVITEDIARQEFKKLGFSNV